MTAAAICVWKPCDNYFSVLAATKLLNSDAYNPLIDPLSACQSRGEWRVVVPWCFGRLFHGYLVVVCFAEAGASGERRDQFGVFFSLLSSNTPLVCDLCILNSIFALALSRPNDILIELKFYEMRAV
jgi:hypothetical protein